MRFARFLALAWMTSSELGVAWKVAEEDPEKLDYGTVSINATDAVEDGFELLLGKRTLVDWREHRR